MICHVDLSNLFPSAPYFPSHWGHSDVTEGADEQDTVTLRVFSRPDLKIKRNIIANIVKHLTKYLRVQRNSCDLVFTTSEARSCYLFCLTRCSRGRPGPRIQRSDPLRCATPKPMWSVQCRSGQWKPSKGVQGRLWSAHATCVFVPPCSKGDWCLH